MNTSARSAILDPRNQLLLKVLSGTKQENAATMRAIESEYAGISEHENQQISEYVAENPQLSETFRELADELEVEFARIPPVEVEIQPLDENGKAFSSAYTVVSQDGYIDLGVEILTTEEFLLRIQSSNYTSSQRALFADDNYKGSDTFYTLKFWRRKTIPYFFDSSVSSSDKKWFLKEMKKISKATGMRFSLQGNDDWEVFWHRTKLSGTLMIAKKNLSGSAGIATIGRPGSPILKMDPDSVDKSGTDEDQEVFHHEMGHVFGLLHEHQRYDRNKYVSVSGKGRDYSRHCRKNRYSFLFFKWTRWNTQTKGTPFDFQSIMIYNRHGRVRLKITDNIVPDTSIAANFNKYRDIFEYIILQHTYVAKINELLNQGLEIPENFYDNYMSAVYKVYAANPDDAPALYSPWDIYMIKRQYGISPNPRPTYTPRPNGGNVQWPL